MNEKHENTCTALNYIEQSLTLVSAITGYISIFACASLVGVSIGIVSSGIRIKEQD